jgi:aminoglycoside 3-N-acetyltransferase
MLKYCLISKDFSQGVVIVNDLKLLQSKWFNSGIEPGDTLLLHSNMTRTLLQSKRINRNIRPIDFLDCLLDLLGPNGTLLTPLYNFDFTKGIPFDFKHTKSQMGILTELARNHPKSIRSGHPIYSFSIIGAKQNHFLNLNNKSAYSIKSPFGILTELDGKIGVIDLEDQDSMTYYHHVEQMCNVDYRYHKNFTGLYTCDKGLTSSKTYSIFVRKIEDGVITSVNSMSELLWRNKLYKGDLPGENSGMRTIKAREMFSFVEDIILQGKARGTLYDVVH